LYNFYENGIDFAEKACDNTLNNTYCIIQDHSGGRQMSSSVQLDNMELDEEWIQLILNARNMGLSSADIRTFLKSANHPARNLHNPTKNEQLYIPMGLIVPANM
jgi:hypothetical protein